VARVPGSCIIEMPEDYLRIHGPLYLDANAEEIGFDPPDQFDSEWLNAALEALAVFAQDIPAWRARARHRSQVYLRFQFGDDFVDDRVFDHDALPSDPDTQAKLADFVDAVSEANREHALWSDSENHLGGDIATRLAERSPEQIIRFIHFLESNDLNHEVSQSGEVMRVLKAHGWRPETLALWVARLGTCAGQHGHEMPWEECVDAALAEYISGDPARRALLIRLMAGNMLAQLDYPAESVEFNLQALAKDVLDVFWDDLDRQGLGELAAGILTEAHVQAQKLVREYAGPNRPTPPHWLSALDA
jgi:hypothetical protein